MAAPKGNRFWEARSSHGRKPIFDNPDKLRDACYQYFHWAYVNPLTEMRPFAYQGVVVQEPVPLMRAFTIRGLCGYLDISQDTWERYRDKDDLCGVTEEVENLIYDQKFTGASEGLLNANIIARDLGLKDHTQSDTVTRHQIGDLSDDELRARIAELAASL